MDGMFTRDSLIHANGFFRLDERRMRDLLSALESLSSNKALQRRAEAVHDYFFHSDLDVYAAHARWKEEAAFDGPDRAAYAAVMMMTGLGHMMEAYRKRGIPEDRLRASLRDMAIWMDACEERTGRTGLEEVGWVMHSLRGELFRIGRFQFFRRVYESKACIFTRKADRAPVAFFMEPELLRRDGQVDGTNDIYDAEGAWQSRFEMNDETIEGTPLHPGGSAVRKELRLPAGEWELALKPGDGMLDIHIPKDGKMEFGECRDSILEAMRFFDTYFPDRPYKTIHLCTWFLDAQLQMLLPMESNIVRFQREFYLIPVLACDIGCYERVFGSADIDIKNAPEDTSLRRAIKQFVLKGNRMRYNTGLILPQDMARFGEAQYQTRAAVELEKLLALA